MYAIVDIAGQQFKVEKGKKIFVNRLEGEKGASLDFSKVLLTDDNGSVKSQCKGYHPGSCKGRQGTGIQKETS